jgi:hypothetical protein
LKEALSSPCPRFRFFGLAQMRADFSVTPPAVQHSWREGNASVFGPDGGPPLIRSRRNDREPTLLQATAFDVPPVIQADP